MTMYSTVYVGTKTSAGNIASPRFKYTSCVAAKPAIATMNTYTR